VDLEALTVASPMPYLKLMRPINGVMASVAAVIGLLITLRLSLDVDVVKVVILLASTFLFSSSSMVMNDYFDREVDAVNQPQRPIPSGEVRPRNALAFSITLMVIGLALSSLISLEALAIAVLACVTFTAYNKGLKKYGLIGNACVSLCVALTFVYGASTAGGIEGIVLLFSGMAFLANMSREVIKGIADVEGDKIRDVKTLAISHGPRIAAEVAYAFMVSAVALSFAPIGLGYVNWLYLPIVLVADVGLLASALIALSSPTPEGAVKSKKLMLIFMGLALMAFITGCTQSPMPLGIFKGP
jgi:geranylgeranylglycerol-phosphate geranylgeranyltransferase